MKDFWKKMTAEGPLAFLAPMDGYTDSAYRQVVKSVNSNVLCVTEFYSADGLCHSKYLADSVLPHQKTENPLIVQIFGKDPETFAQAAKIIEQYDVAGIDINMGCPAKKVINSGHGSGLIINRDTAYQIVETLNKATHLPISVKTRLGWKGPESLRDFAKGLENAGASLITVHGRTTAQAYTGQADFSQIYELKKTLSIPVIGNGDILNYSDGLAKLQNLDGFMIGRGSFGNPWCFIPDGETIDSSGYVRPGIFEQGQYIPTLCEILTMMAFHAEKLIACKGEKKGTLDIRKHLVQYLKGFPGVSKYRKRLVTIESYDELAQILLEIKTEFALHLHLPCKLIASSSELKDSCGG